MFVQLQDNKRYPRINGAWIGLYHWSEKEGRLWNQELKSFTTEDWQELVRGMDELQMDYLIIQETFRNQQYHARHSIQKKGYQGKAFFPSNMVSSRMDIADSDPIETILAESDRLNKKVFLGLRIYAWFDFTKDSLEWHKKVANELWKRYGHHRSLYGWYISEEVVGSITPPYKNNLLSVSRFVKCTMDKEKARWTIHCKAF